MHVAVTITLKAMKSFLMEVVALSNFNQLLPKPITRSS